MSTAHILDQGNLLKPEAHRDTEGKLDELQSAESRWAVAIQRALQSARLWLKSKGIPLRWAPWIFSLLAPCFGASRALGADLPAGKIVWWGLDFVGQTLNTEQTNGVIESEGEVVTNVVAISARNSECLALKSDGTVMAFGLDFNGGNNVPADLSNVVSIAVEGNSYWAIRHEGTVVRWGGDQDDANVVAGLSNVTGIAWAGYRSYLALRRDGTVLGFRLGPSDSGRVDPATGLLVPDAATNISSVQTVKAGGAALSNVVALSSMGYTPLLLKNDGRVFCLGYQTPGAPRAEPVIVSGEQNTLWISMGGESWRTPYEYTTADLVETGGKPLSNVVALASGGFGHALALMGDGTAVSWAESGGVVPVPQGLSNVIAVATGGGGGLALKSDGQLVGWNGSRVALPPVPEGLTNVLAIAAGGSFNLALTTGNVPPSVFIQPHGRLEEIEREADLIFKGRVISSRAVTNSLFPYWANTYATRFGLISVLKGTVDTNAVVFWHMTQGPGAWGGGAEPSWHKFETGECFIVFAAKLDKPEYLYNVPPDVINRSNEFRQLYRDGVTKTLDARPVVSRVAKDAHWVELGLLLHDSNATNQLYAIATLDRMSLAGRSDDRWSRSDDFKRRVVLSELLPLITNNNEQVARQAINCFETGSNAAVRLAPFAAELVQVANKSRSPGCRLSAISALSGTAGGAVSNSLAQLLKDPNDKIRLDAVRLLPRFPVEYLEQALRERADDPSAEVRSVVADVIGDGKLVRLLPMLVRLFADPVGRDTLIAPLTMQDLRVGRRWSNIGDVHTSAGFALVSFEPAQVADILRANLGDKGFHINFVSRLAEIDAEPWLPELAKILEERLKYVDEYRSAPALDPKRFTDSTGDKMLDGTYGRCWEDFRQYLLKQPGDKLSGGELDRYMDLLDKTVRPPADCPTCCLDEAKRLYELYQTKKLAKHAAELRSHYEKSESRWFDEFDKNH